MRDPCSLENTVRRMEHYNESALTASINSAKEIGFTILSMTVSLAAVFLPLVLMSGLMGRIFREFSITIIISIIASGVVSLTLTPLMCARLLGHAREGDEEDFVAERVIGGVEATRTWRVWAIALVLPARPSRWVSAISSGLCA